MNIEVVFKKQINDGHDIQAIIDWLHEWENLDKTGEISIQTVIYLETNACSWAIGFSEINESYEISGNYGDYFYVLKCGKDYLFNKLSAGNISKATSPKDLRSVS